MANEEIDKTTGDLIFTIKQLPHKIFERRGDDLFTNLKIDLIDALKGSVKEIRHLDNHTIRIEIPKGRNYGSLIRVEQQGFPIPHSGNQFGNLYVKIEIEYPKISPDKYESKIE